jgi:serine/threonine-protein kinase
MTGMQLGPYRLVDRIGAGGMGEVYRARDDRLQREVALKILPAARADDDAARTRLIAEARVAAALNHPHICTIYDVGEADGQAYIAMELVDGEPLDRVLTPGGLDVDAALTLGVQIAEAVAHAHEKGVLHRDLKAANIMVTADRRVKVLDFGLAKRVVREQWPDAPTEATLQTSAEDRITGTLAYMAPEQLRGQSATAASDVWAIGVVLHEMFAGERPFHDGTGFEIASAILEQHPRALPPTVPTILRGVISRCLAKDPTHRYRHAGELLAALEAIAATSAPVPHVLAAAAAVEDRQRRWIAAGALTIIGGLAAIVLLARGIVMPSMPNAGAPRIDAIAVLPLDNLSGDPDEAYLAAGLQAGLIAELARLRTLTRVIERRSTERVAATASIADVASRLGVDAVVTGSVLRTGQRVQVTAQLIDAATERHLWSDRFEREFGEVLSIQGDVVRAVAAAIDTDLTDEEIRRWTNVRVVDPGVYQAYLRGMHLLARGTGTRDDHRRGIAILQQALERDPGNAQAYAGLALGYVMLGHGPFAEDDAWPRARAAAERALTLDPDLAEAHSALAEVQAYYVRDWTGAEQSFRRALALNPNLAMAHYHYAWFLALFSRWDEAFAEHRRAQDVDPLTPVHTAHLGSLYLYVNRHDEAIREARKAIEFAPRAPVAWGVLAWGLNAKGQYDEAEAALRTGLSINPAMIGFELAMFNAARGRHQEARALLDELEAQPPMPWQTWSLSQLSVAIGDHDRAFKWLAVRPAHAFLPWVRVHPPYRPIHKDPRFAALMTELRLPPP